MIAGDVAGYCDEHHPDDEERMDEACRGVHQPELSNEVEPPDPPPERPEERVDGREGDVLGGALVV